MTIPGPSRNRSPDPPGVATVGRESDRTDYAGAVYGSLLAASVIAASDVHGAHPKVSLIVLLMVTGVVFWIAHVYAHLAGERQQGLAVNWHEVRQVGRHEWPIVEAAVIPSLAVLVSPWLGMGENAWLAISVAIGQQVFWTTLGALRTGATKTQTAVEAGVSLTLGLVIVAAKVVVGH